MNASKPEASAAFCGTVVPSTQVDAQPAVEAKPKPGLPAAANADVVEKSGPKAAADATPAGSVSFDPSAGGAPVASAQSLAAKLDAAAPVGGKRSVDVGAKSVAAIIGETVEIQGYGHSAGIDSATFRAPGSKFQEDVDAATLGNKRYDRSGVVEIDTSKLQPGTYRLQITSYIHTIVSAEPRGTDTLDLVLRPREQPAVAASFAALQLFDLPQAKKAPGSDVIFGEVDHDAPGGYTVHPFSDLRPVDGPLVQLCLSPKGDEAFLRAVQTSQPMGPRLEKKDWKYTYYGPLPVPPAGSQLVVASPEDGIVKLNQGNVLHVFAPQGGSSYLMVQGLLDAQGQAVKAATEKDGVTVQGLPAGTYVLSLIDQRWVDGKWQKTPRALTLEVS